MKAKEARKLINSAYANIQALRANGYWPLVSPNPSSTEEKLIESIQKVEKALLDADLYHAMLYGRRPEIEVSCAPCAKIVETKANPTSEDMMQAILKRCREHIALYEERVQLALDIVDVQRCPLSLAAPYLYDRVNDIIDEYGNDEELDTDDITAEDIIFYREG